MKRIDFFSLARPIQERFVESTRGQGVPVPMLVARLPLPMAAIGWALASALAVVGWVYAVRLGYGKLESPLSLQPTWLLVVEGGLLVLAVVLALQSRRSLRQRLRLPFVPTVYLFPVGVVDARSQNVVVHGWDELRNLDVTATRARVAFAHGSFDFPVDGAARAADVKERAEEHRQKLAGAGPPEKDLVMMDPLRDNGFKNPFSPVDSMRPPKPARLPVLEISLLAFAVVLAFGVFQLRNHTGERALYERSVTSNSIESYRAYLLRGGTRTDVSELLLPRAELRAAVAENTVEGIERYIAAHPGSKIDNEIQTALRAALLRALEEAKQKGTITALREFEEKYKRHLKLVPELPGARVAYLAGVLDRFHKTAKPSKELWLMARRLIVYADQHGPRVAIRFARQESRTVEKNERMLTASAYYGGDRTLPSRFIAASAQGAAERAGQELAAALGKAFPSDLIHFELGPPVDPSAPLPRFTEPTILMTYRLEISNPLSAKKPRGIWSTVGVTGTTSFSIPDKEPPAEAKYTSWHAPDIRRVEAGELAPENVYADLLSRAWTRFTTKYAAPWTGAVIETSSRR